MDNKWQAGSGDLDFDKSTAREMLQHVTSSDNASMDVGEIRHDAAADQMKMKLTAGVEGIASDTDLQALKTRGDVETDSNGKGVKRTLVQQAAAPTTAADEIALYCKAVGGVPEFFVRSEASGVEIQITTGGKLNAAADTGPKVVAEQGSDPAPAANQGAFYTKDVNAKTEAFFISDAGTVQLTSAGALSAAGADAESMVIGSRVFN
jgi:hypothetical protein